MSLFLIIFGIISSIIELYYSLYLTAIVHIFSIPILIILATGVKQGSYYRISIVSYYLFAYIFPILIILFGFSTKSGPQYWDNNSFIFSDINIAFVSFVALISYAILILIHRLSMIFAKSFLNLQESAFAIKLNISPSFRSKRHLFWIIMLSSLVLIIQNYYGWGVHGLPMYSENFFKAAGISIYARDIFIPVIFVYLLYKGMYKSVILPILFIFLAILTSLSSLSKVTMFVYFLVLYLAFIRIQIVNIRPFSFIKTKMFIVFTILLLTFLLQSALRDILIGFGEPIRLQIDLAINILSNGINYVNYATVVPSLMERLLGFNELASVLYSNVSGDSYINLLHYIFAINQEGELGYTSVRDLTGSTIGGGVGLDLVGAIAMTEQHFIVPIVYIFVIFLFQNIIINSINKQRKLVEFFFIILSIRFLFIDSNFMVLMKITIVLYLVLFTFKLLKKYSYEQV